MPFCMLAVICGVDGGTGCTDVSTPPELHPTSTAKNRLTNTVAVLRIVTPSFS